jgi:hypothetical protein
VQNQAFYIAVNIAARRTRAESAAPREPLEIKTFHDGAGPPIEFLMNPAIPVSTAPPAPPATT